MKIPKSIKAVIFDMDGTMISNMPYHRNAWLEFSRRHGIPMTKDYYIKNISGRNNKHTLEKLFKRSLSTDEVVSNAEEKEAIYRELYVKDIKEVEGLTDLIHKLQKQGIKLAIATTAPLKNREFVLEKLRLKNVFSLIIGDEEVAYGKPDPEIYIKTLRQLGEDPNNCLVFEDTPVGIEAAKKAGTKVIGVLTRHTVEELSASDGLINDFTEVEI